MTRFDRPGVDRTLQSGYLLVNILTNNKMIALPTCYKGKDCDADANLRYTVMSCFPCCSSFQTETVQCLLANF